MKRTVSTRTHGTAAAIRLSPISYVVLGLVGLRGPSTPYQLKRAVGRSITYFWPFPHSQLYDEPERLAAAGLLVEEREESGRRRRIYALSRSGRKALAAWLRNPPDAVFELRDMAVLQLFFSDFMKKEDLVALARAQTRLYERRLVEYDAIAQRNAGRPGRARRMASLDLGRRMARATLGFWRDIAEMPPEGPRRSK